MIASDAMLNSVRYHGVGCFIRNVHWLHALVMAMRMVGAGPSISRAAKSTM